MIDPLVELMERFVSHIPGGTDHKLTVLKGHLICEEQLFFAITSAVKEPKYIEKANLRFSQLLEVAKAHYFVQKHSWAWGALHKLNSIRNSLSHHLEPADFEVNLRDLVELIEQNVPKRSSKSYEDRMRFALAMLAGVIHTQVRIQNA